MLAPSPAPEARPLPKGEVGVVGLGLSAAINSSTMRCSGCATENPAGMKFCGNCGAALGSRCPRCGLENPPEFKFCGECGMSLTLAREAIASAKPTSPVVEPSVRMRSEQAAADAAGGERKTVTALFADIKGSMDLMEGLDPEEARAIVDPALKLMIDAVHRYDGYIVQSTGDGIFALFGAPVAHEDHPQRAPACGAANAGRDAALLRDPARGGESSHRGTRRHQHWRGCCALDQNRACAYRIHPDWAFDQPRVADAGPGADRIDRGHRNDREALRRIFQLQGAGTNAR